MKNSIDHCPRQAVTIKHELCSDKCGTCFDNRGCIYDHYLFAAILNMDTSQQNANLNIEIQQPSKDHSIVTNAAAA